MVLLSRSLALCVLSFRDLAAASPAAQPRPDDLSDFFANPLGWILNYGPASTSYGSPTTTQPADYGVTTTSERKTPSASRSPVVTTSSALGPSVASIKSSNSLASSQSATSSSLSTFSKTTTSSQPGSSSATPRSTSRAASSLTQYTQNPVSSQSAASSTPSGPVKTASTSQPAASLNSIKSVKSQSSQPAASSSPIKSAKSSSSQLAATSVPVKSTKPSSSTPSSSRTKSAKASSASACSVKTSISRPASSGRASSEKASRSRTASSERASSGSAMSSRTSSVATRSLIGSVTPSTYSCPPITTTTQTETFYSYIVTSNSTYPHTLSNTIWSSTTTSTVTGLSTAYTAAFPGGWSATSTFTDTTYYNVSITVVPATATVTVPTPTGFLPVLCDERYYDATSSLTIYQNIESLVFITSTIMPTEPSVTYATVYTGTVTSTFTNIGTLTEYIHPTVYSTSTRAEATSTVYAACSPDNLTPKAPGGFVPITDYLYEPQIVVPAVDAIDCCAQCQANTTCGTSAYYASASLCLFYPLEGPLGPPVSCNATQQVSRVFGVTNETREIYISNSGCGRWQFHL